jgi:hypothetical protein
VRARRDRQHWLPRAYLRPFRAGSNDTVFVLDFLAREPLWERVGFFAVGNTDSFHSLGEVDQRIDNELVNAYAAIRDKILRVTRTTRLAEVLGPDEARTLAKFIHVHAWRNPLMSYRLAMNELIERAVTHPWRPIPMTVPRPMAWEVVKLRWQFFRKRRRYDDADKHAVIIRRVREMILEDSYAHLELRYHPILDQALDQFIDSDDQVELEDPLIIWSDEPLYTMDMPFVLEGEPGHVRVTLAISPHHLLEAGEPVDPSWSALERLAHLPFMSYSTKLIAAEPMDVELRALARFDDDGVESLRLVPIELTGVPVRDTFV